MTQVNDDFTREQNGGNISLRVRTRLTEPYSKYPDFCCKTLNCQSYFSDEYCTQMRRDLWSNRAYSRDDQRYHIHYAWKNVFVVGVERKPCCNNFIRNVYKVSRSFIYHQLEGASRQRNDDKTIALITWFDIFKENCDPMPDSERNEYQVFAPTKRAVYNIYTADSVNCPQVWPQLSYPTFIRVWKKYKSNFKLRRHLRFSKCRVCVTLREVRYDPAYY